MKSWQRSVLGVLVYCGILNTYFLVPATYGEGVTVQPGAPAAQTPSINAAPNGVPLVDIVRPNGAGLSHNVYGDFNIDSRGLILNNSTDKWGTSVLGGVVMGNPNLRNGTAARVVLNEVAGVANSQLNGALELYGTRAHVILANANGIVVNGGNFINIPRVTLTTGIPIIGGDGALQAYRIGGGQISIEGHGADGSAVDAFELITRTAEFAADLHVKGDLSIITGRNEVKADNLETSELDDDGSAKPLLAIDSKALGGMYAGKIHLVASEKGVGVNTQGAIAASAGDLILQAKGPVQVRKASATSDVNIRATNQVQIDESVGAGRNLQIVSEVRDVSVGAGAALVAREATSISASSGGIFNAGEIGAGGTLWLNSGLSLGNTGSILTSGNITGIIGGVTLNQGSISSGSGGLDWLSAGTVWNEGLFSAYQGVNLVSEFGGIINASSGILGSKTGSLNAVTASSITNHGLIFSGQNLTLSGASLLQTGRVLADGNTALDFGTGAFLNQGLISAEGELLMSGGALDNQGLLTSGGDLSGLLLGDFINTGGIATGGDFIAASQDLRNTGNIITDGAAAVLATGGFTNAGEFSATTGIQITAKSQIDLQATSFLASGGYLFLESDGALISAISLSAPGDVSIHAASFNNTASQILASGKNLDLILTGDLNNAGTIFALENLHLGVDGSVTQIGGNLLSKGNLTLTDASGTGRATSLLNSSGLIESTAGRVTLNAETITNERTRLEIQRDGEDLGQIITVEDRFEKEYHLYGYHITNAHHLPLIFGEYDPNSGDLGNSWISAPWYGRNIWHTNDLEITTQRFRDVLITDSGAATIRGAGDVMLNAGDIFNRSSTISAGNDLIIAAGTLVNSGDALLTRTDVISRQERFALYRVSKRDGGDTWGTAFSWDTPITDTTYAVTQPFTATLQAGGQIIGDIQSLENSALQPGSTGQSVTLPAPAYLTGTSIDPANGYGSATLPEGIWDGLVIDPAASLGSLSQLFLQPTSPDSPYLYETRPEFASLGRFLGSDYFFDQLGLPRDSIEAAQKRLGDSYFETQLVRSQLERLTGKSSSGGDYELMRRLIDAGVSAAQDLELVPGISLSAEQAARLTDDIVWFETRTVQGKQVTVPVVYLASATLAGLSGSSAEITATSVDLTLSQLHNQGTLKANQSLRIKSDQLLNRGGSILSGGSLFASATGDILNESGSIRGNEVILKAGNDILSRTLTYQRKDGQGSNAVTNTYFANMANIEAGSGGLDLYAGRDIRQTAANLTTTDAGNAKLAAARDIVLDTTAVQQENAMVSQYGTYRDKTITHHGSVFDIKGDLSLLAGNDLGLNRATIATGGNSLLAAGNHLTLGTVVDTFSLYNQGSGGGLYNSLSVNGSIEQGSLLNAKGNLSMDSGGDMRLRAAQLKSSGTLTAASGGNLRIEAGQNERHEVQISKSKASSSFGSSKNSSIVTDEQTLTQTLIDAGGDLKLQSHKQLTLEAVQAMSQGDISLSAQDGIDLSAAATSVVQDKQSNSKGFMSKASANSHETWTSDVGNILQAGGDMKLTTPGDINSVATTASAGYREDGAQGENSITALAGGSAYLTEGRSTHTLNSQEKSKGWNASSASTATSASSTAGYGSQKKSENSKEDLAIAGIWSAQDIRITTGKDALLRGQELFATDNIDVSAGGDVSILAASNYSEHQLQEKSSSIGKTVTAEVIGAAANAYHALDVANDRSGRQNALQGISTAGSGYNIAKQFAAGQSFADLTTIIAGVRVTETTGYNSNKRSESEASHWVTPSTLTAGNNLNITSQHDLNVTGSDLTAGHDLTLDAAGNLTLQSALESSTSSHSEKSKGLSQTTSISSGISPAGAITTVGVDVGYQNSKASGSTDILSHRESTATAGNLLTLNSGNGHTSSGEAPPSTGNILLTGALLSGESVRVNAQHSLSIASQQDSFSTHEQTKSSAYGFGGSVTSIHGAFTAELHASFGKTTEQLQGSTLTVNEQSGIFSGPGGYDIHVGKNTTLTGAVIATEGDGSNSRFNTGSLTLNDLTNSMDWRVKTTAIQMLRGSSFPGFAGVIPLSDKGGDQSITLSGIGAGTLTVRDGQISMELVHRNVEQANSDALASLPNLRKIQMEQTETAALAMTAYQMIGKTAQEIYSDYQNSKPKTGSEAENNNGYEHPEAVDKDTGASQKTDDDFISLGNGVINTGRHLGQASLQIVFGRMDNAAGLIVGIPGSMLTGDLFDAPGIPNGNADNALVNGMLNDWNKRNGNRADWLDGNSPNKVTGIYGKSIFAPEELHSVNNGSHYRLVSGNEDLAIGDYAQVLLETFGVITTPSIDVANQMNAMGSGTLYMHSQGTRVGGSGAQLAPYITRANFDAVGMGGQLYISSWYGFASTQNVIREGDPVANLIAPENWLYRSLSPFSSYISLPRNEEYDGIFTDHAFSSKNVRKVGYVTVPANLYGYDVIFPWSGNPNTNYINQNNDKHE